MYIVPEENILHVGRVVKKGANTYTSVRPSSVDRDSGHSPVRLLLFNRLTPSKRNKQVEE